MFLAHAKAAGKLCMILVVAIQGWHWLVVYRVEMNGLVQSV